MPDEPILYETEGGLVIVQGDTVLLSQRSGSGERSARLREIGEKAKESGLTRLKVTNAASLTGLEGLGIETSVVTDEERESLDSRRLAIMVRAGFAQDEAAAMALVKGEALQAAEEKIIAESSREDLHLVHAIQALDELDKFLNITTERVAEWYSLHFPELQQMVQDNVALAKMVTEVGRRENLDEERLKGMGFSEKKLEAVVLARERSKGGTISDRNMSRITGLAEISLKVASEREKLAEYVESTMNKIAPNVGEVAGSTIGARLIAKAGGLDRLARLPASTIQVLGAEKALFRALRTGSRPPKHGILFQHEAVHTAPKWQRGKVARALANKIAIAARIDYYRGERDSSLTGTLEKRLEEIKTKYKEPREVPAPKRFRDEQRPRFGKGRKERGFHKKPRAGQHNVRGRARQDRGR